MNHDNSKGCFSWTGNIADVSHARLYRGTIHVSDGLIVQIEHLGEPQPGPVMVPGLIDAHLHVESTLLTPSSLAKALLPCGTLATLSDPHEIANVMGMEGLAYMLDDSEACPLAYHFGAPSCVPATAFESSGACFGPADIGALLDKPRIRYLSEMMNFPGVVAADPRVLAIIEQARRRGKPIDGHSPGLGGEALRKYVAEGISTDHECTSIEEAREKAALGMHILIREGSSARNASTLLPLLRECPLQCMLCSDDLHPGDIEARGHIDHILRKAVAAGLDPMDALRAATVNPVRHYGLPGGLLRIGDPADMVEMDGLSTFEALRVWSAGRLVAEGGRCLWEGAPPRSVNRFDARPIEAAALRIPARPGRARVIEAIDGQLLTGSAFEAPLISRGCAIADPERDILQIAVLSRYAADAVPALGFVRGFGLREGAIASSVAHDSHNIVALGADAESIARAINMVIAERGALVTVGAGRETVLPLPVAGLMSCLDWRKVVRLQRELDQHAGELGAKVHSPHMLLSFMALPVIPALKISDRGLFDVNTFRPVGLWE